MGTLAERNPKPPDPPPRTFKDALVSHATSTSAIAVSTPSDPIADLGKLGTHKGSPEIYYNRNQVSRYSDPYHQTLVAKFSQGYNKQDPNLGRPSLEKLQEYFLALDLHGEVYN